MKQVLAVFFLASVVLGVDLCATNNGGCGDHATCYGGTNPTVQCVCNDGYVSQGSTCVLINGCVNNNGGCSANAACVPTLGTWNVGCSCLSGFTGNGWWCAVDLCATNNGGCGNHAACYGGTNPTVQCVCNNGYYMQGATCVAVNACATNNGGCDTHALCSTTLGTYTVTCNCNSGFSGSGQYCSVATPPPAPVVTGGESVTGTGLLLRTRPGNCGVGGANICVQGGVTTMYSGDQASMNKYVTPCDVEGTGLDCGNSPNSVHGFLLEVQSFLFSAGFNAPITIDYVDFGVDGQPRPASGLGISTDTAAVIEGYIFGGRNENANYLAFADDILRVMVDFNQDGQFTSDEWGVSNGGQNVLTSGQFVTPGCRHLKGGYYNGPTLRRFRLSYQGGVVIPAQQYFTQLSDCPKCSCAAGSFISADCTATSNAQCTQCCDPSRCDGTTTADPGCAGTWDCPSPGVSFNDWRFPAPVCNSLTVVYPAGVTETNDVNVRIYTVNGEVTLNFHNNGGSWTGTHVFNFLTNAAFPTGITEYSVEWVQVAGSNCHWTPAAGAPVHCTL